MNQQPSAPDIPAENKTSRATAEAGVPVDSTRIDQQAQQLRSHLLDMIVQNEQQRRSHQPTPPR